MLSSDELERYARHIMLKEIGGPGQQRLKSASVAVVGAGGLGAPASLYLTAAGLGALRIIDHDHVALSNLQRQIIFRSDDIAAPKAERAAAALKALNPNVEVDARCERLTEENAATLLGGVDIVLDGADDFATRFAVNAACQQLGAMLVSGAVGRWDGQVGVFPPGGPCYQCFVPEPPPDVETCSAVGIVGALPGVIGSLMALETVKLIAGAGRPLAGRIFLFDGLSGEARTVALPRDPNCPVCRRD